MQITKCRRLWEVAERIEMQNSLLPIFSSNWSDQYQLVAVTIKGQRRFFWYDALVCRSLPRTGYIGKQRKYLYHTLYASLSKASALAYPNASKRKEVHAKRSGGADCVGQYEQKKTGRSVLEERGIRTSLQENHVDHRSWDHQPWDCRFVDSSMW